MRFTFSIDALAQAKLLTLANLVVLLADVLELTDKSSKFIAGLF